MAALVWDRLLETLSRNNGTNLLLAPGSPPMLQIAQQMQALGVPPLAASDVQALAEEMLSKKVSGTSDGYTWLDLNFLHDAGAWFRIMAFGYPDTKVLMVTRQAQSLGRFREKETSGDR
jgi:Tfp pilus assembly pilus retraction ATPase PilT